MRGNAINRVLKFFSIALVVIVLTTGCIRTSPHVYGGEYPDLYSIAINVLLGTKGHIHSEKRFVSGKPSSDYAEWYLKGMT